MPSVSEGVQGMNGQNIHDGLNRVRSLQESVHRMQSAFTAQTQLVYDACAMARKQAHKAEQYRVQAKMNLLVGGLIGLAIGVTIGYII